ncbi:MAG TPA: hypothetical protein VGO31_01140 [Microbacteriaceae bacterium]|jgi:hypothetical protein|nr:hypothetical protein [Microbacteriaceae bacterium]
MGLVLVVVGVYCVMLVDAHAPTLSNELTQRWVLKSGTYVWARIGSWLLVAGGLLMAVSGVVKRATTATAPHHEPPTAQAVARTAEASEDETPIAEPAQEEVREGPPPPEPMAAEVVDAGRSRRGRAPFIGLGVGVLLLVIASVVAVLVLGGGHSAKPPISHPEPTASTNAPHTAFRTRDCPVKAVLPIRYGLNRLVRYVGGGLTMLAPDGWGCEIQKQHNGTKGLIAVPGDGPLAVTTYALEGQAANSVACHDFSNAHVKLGGACPDVQTQPWEITDRIDSRTVLDQGITGSSTDAVGSMAIVYSGNGAGSATDVACVLPLAQQPLCYRIAEEFLTRGKSSASARRIQRAVASANARASRYIASTTPCVTTYGAIPTTNTPSLVHLNVALPEGLSVYANPYERIIAPTGWRCRASVGADGTSTIEAFPPTEHVTTGFNLSIAKPLAVVAEIDPACAGCFPKAACAYFASLSPNGIYGSCGQGAPTGETSRRASSWVFLFEDPSGVTGSGEPSGGPYPANGFVSSGGPSGSRALHAQAETCTLPQSRHAWCTAILDDAIRDVTNPF